MTTREAVVEEARSYLGTPYRKGGRVKGAGVDCGTLLFCVYRDTGFIAPADEGIFSDPKMVPISQDWFCHTDEDKYMKLLLRYAYKVANGISYPSLKAEPGNIVATAAVQHNRVSKVFNHAGIVVHWPRVIHAIYPVVEECDASSHPLWAFQMTVVLDPFAKALAEGSAA